MAETVTAEQIKALFKALASPNEEVVYKIVEEHPDAVNWEYQGFTALNSAITGENVVRSKALAHWLIDKGADPNTPQPVAYGLPPIPFALKWDGDENIALKLLEKGADLNWKSEPGSEQDALNFAGALPDDWFFPGHGMTLLMSAARAGATRVAAALLDRGADINEKDSHGQTALMYATQASQHYAAAFLISRGAQVIDYNNKGHSVLEMAEASVNGRASVPTITEAFRQASEVAAAAMRNGVEKPITVSKATIKLKKSEP